MTRTPSAAPAIVGFCLLMMAGCGSDEAGEPVSSTESTTASTVAVSVGDSQAADSTDPSSVPASTASSTVGTSSPGSTAGLTTAPVGCPDDIVEFVESDLDGDGVMDRVYLRRAGTPSANLVGICSVFDLDRDGDGEIIAFNTSARSLIYNAGALTASGLEITNVVLETTIDSESGEPFNAAGFPCVAGSGDFELVSYRYRPSGDGVQVTTSAIGLDGLSMIQTFIESHDADPSEALSIWNEPDGCFDLTLARSRFCYCGLDVGRF